MTQQANPFGNLNNDGLEKPKDTLGGGGFTVPSDIYLAEVMEAFAGQSSGGAASFTLTFALPEGKKHTEILYVTNKQGQNYFLNKSDQTKKVPLPGFTVANDLCLATLECELKDLQFETRTIKQRNFETKQDELKDVAMAVDLIGKKVKLGLLLEIHNKKSRQPDGSFVETADVQKKNAIDKIFHPTLDVTILEAMSGSTEPHFMKGWLERYKGKEIDRRKAGADAGTAGAPPRPGAPQQAAGGAPAAPARKSLFGAK